MTFSRLFPPIRATEDIKLNCFHRLGCVTCDSQLIIMCKIGGVSLYVVMVWSDVHK